MYKYLFIFFMLISATGLYANENPSWGESKAFIEAYPWNPHSDDGFPDQMGNQYVISSGAFISRVQSSCSNEDVDMLYHIGNFVRLLKKGRALNSDSSIIGCKALIQAAKCETQLMKSDVELPPRYSEVSMSYWYQPNAKVFQGDMDALKTLSREYSNAKGERCELSIEKNRYIWRNCYDIKPLDEILSMISVQEEIMGLKPIQDFVDMDEHDPFTYSRYGVYTSIMANPSGDASAATLHNYFGARYAYEIYNTFSANMELCPESEIDRANIGCLGKTEIFRFFKYLKDKMNAPDFDVSKLQGAELLYVRMLEAGMIDEPDQPPSVKFAKYPPPLVPNWSEYFERDRYTAETGIVLPDSENSSDQYAVAEAPKAEVPKSAPVAVAPKPAPVAKPEKEVVQPDSEPQWLGWLLVGSVIGLLLFAWYGSRRRHKSQD